MRNNRWLETNESSRFCDRQIKASSRLLNCLYYHDIQSWDQLRKLSYAEVSRWRNCGIKTVRELVAVLIAHGEPFALRFQTHKPGSPQHLRHLLREWLSSHGEGDEKSFDSLIAETKEVLGDK